MTNLENRITQNHIFIIRFLCAKLELFLNLPCFF